MPPTNTTSQQFEDNGADKTRLVQKLLNRGSLWHATRSPQNQGQSYASGYQALDEKLPARGWPEGQLIELLSEQQGCGEWSLLSPVLAKLSQAHWLILINPPYIPYAPALAHAGIDLNKLLIVNTHHKKDELWAMEQALNSPSCGAVLCWSEALALKHLRRLQVSAHKNRGLAFLYRPRHFSQHASPAHLRLVLQALPAVAMQENAQQTLQVEIIKRPNGWACAPFNLKIHNFETRPGKASASPSIQRIDLLNIDSAIQSGSTAVDKHPIPLNQAY